MLKHYCSSGACRNARDSGTPGYVFRERACYFRLHNDSEEDDVERLNRRTPLARTQPSQDDDAHSVAFA